MAMILSSRKAVDKAKTHAFKNSTNPVIVNSIAVDKSRMLQI